MEIVTDAAELAQAQEQRKQFDRNAAWLRAHASEIYSRHRGKCICIAGEELFVAETAKEAMALATAHPLRTWELRPAPGLMSSSAVRSDQFRARGAVRQRRRQYKDYASYCSSETFLFRYKLRGYY